MRKISFVAMVIASVVAFSFYLAMIYSSLCFMRMALIFNASRKSAPLGALVGSLQPFRLPVRAHDNAKG